MITPHSGCENLYVATCGSFHGFKFFPVLGKYVVQMLDGVLDAELRAKWAWNRKLPSEDEDSTGKWPTRELDEFV